MRRIALAVLLICGTCALAQTNQYVVGWMRASAPTQDITELREEIVDVTRGGVEWDTLPWWRLVADTNATGRLMCVDVEMREGSSALTISFPQVVGTNTNWVAYPLTKERAEAWCQTNLLEPTNVIWYSINRRSELISEGLEPVPIPDPAITNQGTNLP